MPLPPPPAFRGVPPSDPALGQAFAADSAVGTMVIRRLGDGREWIHAPARADSAFIPASTFKIVNASIALETGVVASPDEAFPWDGVEREFAGWNRDHTLASAMPASVVPVYQEVARRVGEERMADWLARLVYGNADIGGGIDQFWLTGDLRTSAREQVDFLTRFVTGDVPLAARVQEQVRDMLVLDGGPEWALHGKTGWAFDVQVGWWVGWSEHNGETYVFALNMALPDAERDPPKRVRVGRRALAAVGALPSQEGD